MNRQRSGRRSRRSAAVEHAAVCAFPARPLRADRDPEPLFVDDPVVRSAEQDEVGQRGLVAVRPMPDVVRVGPRWCPVAPGEGSAAIAHGERPTDRPRHDGCSAPDVEGLGTTACDDAAHGRVAREPSRCLTRHEAAVAQPCDTARSHFQCREPLLVVPLRRSDVDERPPRTSRWATAAAIRNRCASHAVIDRCPSRANDPRRSTSAIRRTTSAWTRSAARNSSPRSSSSEPSSTDRRSSACSSSMADRNVLMEGGYRTRVRSTVDVGHSPAWIRGPPSHPRDVRSHRRVRATT